MTRSFGRPITDKADMLQAVAAFASRVAEKLRSSAVAAPRVAVFMHTIPSGKGLTTAHQAPRAW